MSCACGHPWHAHEFISGVRFTEDVVVTNEDGTVLTGLPDVWVCSGGRLVDVNDPGLDPWDCVCGCVLHSPPPRPEALGDSA